MGFAKERGLIENWAEGLAEKAGAISRCDVHGTVLDNQDDAAIGLAYKIASNEWKVDSKGFARKQLMEAVKETIEVAAAECYDCQKWSGG